MQRVPWRIALVGTMALTAAMSMSGIGAAAPRGVHGAAARVQAGNAVMKAQGGATTSSHTPDDGDLADVQAQYAAERTAPAATRLRSGARQRRQAGRRAAGHRHRVAAGHQ